MNQTILTGKKIALLGGMGSRGESRDALIKELGLAELNWVYSERNKVKEYRIFCESLYPGKYDYIFILTKFISHKLWEQIKKADFEGTPLIRVNGSYNAEGFLNALAEQSPVKDDKPEEVIQAPVVIKKLLAPAESDKSEFKPQEVIGEDGLDPNWDWQVILGAKTPHAVKARILALETQVKRLEANQQDLSLLKSAASFYNAFVEFVETYPTPSYLTHAKNNLYECLRKHNVIVKENIVPRIGVSDTELMLSNITLGHLFTALKGMVEFFSNRIVEDKRGACIACGRHKSVGCREDCLNAFVGRTYKYIIKGLQVARMPNLKDVDQFLKHE